MTQSVTSMPSTDRRDAADRAEKDRATRTVRKLAQLLAERPELRGVHAPADLADDAIRWSA
ncbi:MAG: hypothetical protein JWO46_1109 [Nocardioidaceae bacterium]|nr:hypothetical protein [Nocardioidaceae bacterium]